MELATTAPVTPAIRDRVAAAATRGVPDMQRRLDRPPGTASAPLAMADSVDLTPPDPWTDALAQLALAAGRVRDLAVAADGAGWPEAMAAHALHLARVRVRELEARLAGPGPDAGRVDAGRLDAGRVVCWAP